jgi:phytoene synthase
MRQEEDIAAVTAIVKAAGTSFYYGMKMLEPARRDAMYAVYAFCRVVDDIADEPGAFDDKIAALNAWRGHIAALYEGAPFDAITRCLAAAITAYQLPQNDFLAIIDGMEMDAGDPIVAPTLATLDLYCDRVASAVGRLSVRIFGDSSAAAQDVAYALGRALQLTNILRDVGTDAAQGRLYLPYEFLAEARIPPVPALALGSENLPNVCSRIAAMAEQNFRQAFAAMALCNAAAMRPARLMAASYRPLLGIMRRRGYHYADRPVSLPKWRKALLALRLMAA